MLLSYYFVDNGVKYFNIRHTRFDGRCAHLSSASYVIKLLLKRICVHFSIVVITRCNLSVLCGRIAEYRCTVASIYGERNNSIIYRASSVDRLPTTIIEYSCFVVYAFQISRPVDATSRLIATGTFFVYFNIIIVSVY